MLKDQYGRRFEYLRLSITDLCNFRCNYCLPDGVDCSASRDFLSLDEIDTLIRAFACLGMKKVRITGGEPGLRKDLGEVIKLCSDIRGIEEVALTTNGFNLDKNIGRWINSGLTGLNVSVDSLDSRIFSAITGHHKLEKILAGISKAQILGLRNIKLNTVILKQFNFGKLDEYLNWIIDKPITIRFIELMETGDNQHFFNENHVSAEFIKAQLLQSGWLQIKKSKYAGPAQEFEHRKYQGKIGLIMPYSKGFCSTCNRLRVSAKGSLQMCLFAQRGVELRGALATGDVSLTCRKILNAMSVKVEAHQLSEHKTGSIANLAQIGG